MELKPASVETSISYVSPGPAALHEKFIGKVTPIAPSAGAMSVVSPGTEPLIVSETLAVLIPVVLFPSMVIV